MASRRPLLVIALCLLTSLVVAERSGRELLQTKKEIKEQEREGDALESYYLQQSNLNKEQEAQLRLASEEAVTLVKKIDKSDRNKQVKIFSDLWVNAEGVAIVKTLALLIELSPKKKEYFYELNSDSMQEAEDSGYSFKVSEALYNAMAVRDESNDHYHLLDALLYRMQLKEDKKKGSGCQYVEYLFTDAESWAIDDGRAQQFFQGFDNEDYIDITECFLEECKGSAAKCCGDKKAVSSGLCGCKVIDKKEGTLQCEHNLFWTAPRTIWLCGTSNCLPDEKCLCGKSSKKSVTSKTSKKSSDSKGEEKDVKDTKKPKTSKDEEKDVKDTKKPKTSKDEEKDGKDTKKSKSSSKKSGKYEDDNEDTEVKKYTKSKSKDSQKSRDVESKDKKTKGEGKT